MKRKEQRLLRKLEKEPVKGLIRTQKHFYSDLQKRLNEVKDPRDTRYTIYDCSTLIGTGITKNICGITSMQQMTAAFNNENCIQNISAFVGNENEELPHYVTLNDFLERLEPSELQKVRKEFIENNAEDAERQKEMNAEQIKQDCERKAFKRLAARMKKDFPRLPIILLCDSLYACEPVFDICKNNNWDYIIRYKEGSIPSIMEEYELIPDKGHGKKGKTEFVNDIGYKKHEVNVLKFEEKQVRKGEVVIVRFQWLTSLKITEKNAYEIACVGRKRWKIENEGFNTQKNLRYDLEHANSHDANAQKNHYLITQIADIFRQLYVYWELEKIGIKKSEKIYLPTC